MMSIIEFPIRETIHNENDFNKIILCHTSRNIEEYLIGLKFRSNSKYNKLPHYVISREGNLVNTLDTKNKSFIFSDELNNNSIVICLENLGWLEKKPLKGEYLNWIGNIYKGEVFNKSWRDYSFWEPYNDLQIKETAKLCSLLCDQFKIKKECLGTNTKIKGVEKYEGIICRSNLYIQLTDLSPAFDFEKFEKYLKDGK